MGPKGWVKVVVTPRGSSEGVSGKVTGMFLGCCWVVPLRCHQHRFEAAIQGPSHPASFCGGHCLIWGALFPILDGGSVSPTPEDHETHEDHEACGDPRAGVFIGGRMIHRAVPPPQFARCHCSPPYTHPWGVWGVSYPFGGISAPFEGDF